MASGPPMPELTRGQHHPHSDELGLAGGPCDVSIR